MSQLTAAARAGARPAPRPATGSRLRVVSGRSQVSRGNTAFAVLCVALLGAGLGALLMLNIALGRGSYTVHTLQATTGELSETKDQLNQALAGQRSAAALAERAAAMGMVPAQSAAFLRLTDGAVVGVASKSAPTERFTVVKAPQPPPPKTPAELAAEKKAAAVAKAAADKAAAVKKAAKAADAKKAAAAKAAVVKSAAEAKQAAARKAAARKAAARAGTPQPGTP